MILSVRGTTAGPKLITFLPVTEAGCKISVFFQTTKRYETGFTGKSREIRYIYEVK